MGEYTFRREFRVMLRHNEDAPCVVLVPQDRAGSAGVRWAAEEFAVKQLGSADARFLARDGKTLRLWVLDDAGQRWSVEVVVELQIVSASALAPVLS